MAKAGGETTTARIGLSRAIEFAGEYLGDPEVAEREIRKGLATREIPWWRARFEAPEGNSGPGPGDPEFWKFEGQLRTRDGSAIIKTWREIHIEGNSAIRTDDAAAYGIELDRSALVRLGLLPPDDVDSDGDEAAPPRVETRSSKSLITAEVERRVAKGERWDSITELSRNLHEWMKTVSAKPLASRSIEALLHKLKLWPLPPKK